MIEGHQYAGERSHQGILQVGISAAATETSTTTAAPNAETQAGRPQLQEPPKYAVLLHNDHYTTMEFVVEILRRYFRRTEQEAVQIMLRVHQDGKGVAGIYDLEIAETKVVQVHEFARSRGYPLKCSIDPVK